MYWFFWLRSMAQSPGCNGFVARTWELPPRQVAFGTPPSFILSQGLPARGTPPGPNSNTSLSALSMTWNLADSLARRNAALAAEAARQAAAAALVANAAQAAQRGQARGAEAEAATPGEAPAGGGGDHNQKRTAMMRRQLRRVVGIGNSPLSCPTRMRTPSRPNSPLASRR